MAKKKKALESYQIEQLPNKREVELYVLASLLQNNQEEAILTLNEDVFFHNDLKEIFRSARRVKAENGEINILHVLSDMEADKVSINTFDAIGRETLGAEWSGNLDDIRGLQRKTFTSTMSYLQGMGAGAAIYERIQELKDLYASRMAQKAATLLANSAKLGADKVLECMAEVQTDLTRASAQNFASIFQNKTKESIEERRSHNHEGIGTNYYVFNDGKRTEIRIPRGAITLVCGLPGHCKSTLLLNLALRLAHTEEGSVIYWTFEEAEEKAAEKFESLNYGKELNSDNTQYGGNVDRIREYHHGKKDRIKDVLGFEKSLTELENMETSGKLKIISPNVSSLDFVSSLRAHIATSGEKIAAVFVDYIQIVKSGRNLETRHDIAEALNDFLNFAKETNIPIIAAAQLNRDAATPERMGGRHIAESADLTRFADTILCLWNPSKKDDIDLKEKEYNSFVFGTWYEEHLGKWGFEIGKGGKVYVKVSKARDIEAGADAVYSYNGSVKAIGRTPRELKADSRDSEDLPTGNDSVGNPDNWGLKPKEEEEPKTEKSLFNLRGY